MNVKTVITAETLQAVIQRDNPKSLSQLAHLLGYRGSVSSSVTKKFRALIPNISELLAKDGDVVKATNAPKTAKQAVKKAVAKPVAQVKSKWPNDPRNPFVRPTSAYHICFNILAAHPDGMPKEKLIQLLSKATAKDTKHAGYDAQVLLSARPNEDGLSNSDSPRHRSCRSGFWIKRTNGFVQLMID